MARPVLLDLFCGAGGTAKGYADAGFEVIGVDRDNQPHYPYTFYRGDVFTLGLELARSGDFDMVHASPPCQRFSRGTRPEYQDNHPDLIDVLRDQLNTLGLPWVMENVPEAEHLTLCGSMFGLNVQRHRNFEFSAGLVVPRPRPCAHTEGMLTFMHTNEAEYCRAQGIDWMTTREGRQAIPPAYTAHIGKYLISAAQDYQADRLIGAINGS